MHMMGLKVLHATYHRTWSENAVPDLVRDRGYTGPHTRVVRTCAPIAPRGCPVDSPLATTLAHQRAATVALASIGDAAIGSPSLRTQHGGINFAAAVPVLLVASCVADDVHLRLLENRRLGTTRAESPPACDPAARSRLHIGLWESHCAHATVELHWRLQADQPEIVGIRPGIVVGRRDDPR